MCLAIPMQIVEINGNLTRCQAKGIERQVSLFMMQNHSLQVGDYVMVHVGYAIQKVNPEEALLSWELHDKMDQMAANENPDHA
jgi:hydrogenase expression/formation protein HypC